MIVKLHTT